MKPQKTFLGTERRKTKKEIYVAGSQKECQNCVNWKKPGCPDHDKIIVPTCTEAEKCEGFVENIEKNRVSEGVER